MADRYPKSIEELNAALIESQADVARLSASVANLQAIIVQRDAQITALRRPKPKPRVLDPAAADRFHRPAVIR